MKGDVSEAPGESQRVHAIPGLTFAEWLRGGKVTEEILLVAEGPPYLWVWGNVAGRLWGELRLAAGSSQ
jgi:hypothetical protein